MNSSFSRDLPDSTDRAAGYEKKGAQLVARDHNLTDVFAAGAIVSTIKPKEDLGYSDAQHIHDAAWYVTGKGGKQEVYIVFTNWNPGGIGALKLVNAPD